MTNPTLEDLPPPKEVSDISPEEFGEQVTSHYEPLVVRGRLVGRVAEAVGSGDQRKIGETVLTLRRVCWLTGSAGALTMAEVPPPNPPTLPPAPERFD